MVAKLGKIIQNGRKYMAKFATKICANATAIALIFSTVPTYAKTPSSLSDLVGARAAGGEEQMESRGYYNTHTTTRDDRKWTYWWNSSKKECVSVVTYDGRYETVNSASASDCGQKSSSGDKTAAVAIGAAALIGVLALAHKSDHHDDRNHYDNSNREAQFERGYRDGLYNHAYHNYDRSDAYSSGFEQGVRQRGHETPYRPGYGNGGGYSGNVYVNDLVGQSKGSANSSLTQRGFVIKGSDQTEYEGRYTTWWRAASEQCITVNTRNGFVDTVQSARPRNCR